MQHIQTTDLKRRTHPIELPKSVIIWVLKNVRFPIQGYEHKKRNGRNITFKEQLSETHYQLLLIATDYYKKGIPEENIYQALSIFVRDHL